MISANRFLVHRLLLACVLTCLAFSRASWGLQLKMLSSEELMKHTEVVVWGEVVQIEVHPITSYRLAVLEAREVIRAPDEFRQLRDFKIALENRYLRKDDLLERVHGAPELKVGDELLVFLDPLKAEMNPLRYQGNEGVTLFSMRGFQQGAFRIFADELGVRRALAWNQMKHLPAVSDAELKSQFTGVRQKRSLKTQLLPAAYQKNKVPTLESLTNEVRASSWVPDASSSQKEEGVGP